MALILQTTFTNAFLCLKIDVLWLKVHWYLFPRVQSTISQHYFRLQLGAEHATSHYLNQWMPGRLLYIWHHQMKTFSALLALCAGNSPVIGEFPSQRPVTWTFVSLICALNKWLIKQLWSWWFETPSCSLWRHCNVYVSLCIDKQLVVTADNSFESMFFIESIRIGTDWLLKVFLHGEFMLSQHCFR